jgi:F-type H+-transporting ATPase subunit b
MNIDVIKSYLPEMVTQLLGFLIVFVILKKYAFASILGIIDARRKKIADEFAGIEHKKHEMETLEKEYRTRLDKIEEAAREKIAEASKIGQNLAKDIQEAARLDAKKLFDRTQSDIEQEIAKGRLALRNEIVDISTMLTEKVLRERLDAKEQDKLVEKFLKELERV